MQMLDSGKQGYLNRYHNHVQYTKKLSRDHENIFKDTQKTFKDKICDYWEEENTLTELNSDNLRRKT